MIQVATSIICPLELLIFCQLKANNVIWIVLEVSRWRENIGYARKDNDHYRKDDNRSDDYDDGDGEDDDDSRGGSVERKCGVCPNDTDPLPPLPTTAPAQEPMLTSIVMILMM